MSWEVVARSLIRSSGGLQTANEPNVFAFRSAALYTNPVWVWQQMQPQRFPERTNLYYQWESRDFFAQRPCQSACSRGSW